MRGRPPKPLEIKIDISEQDIVDGVSFSSTCCAIAKNLERKKYTDIDVSYMPGNGYVTIQIYHHNRWYQYHDVNIELCSWLNTFDKDRQNAKPASFDLQFQVSKP